MNEQHHFYTVSFLGWNADKNLDNCIAKQRRMDRESGSMKVKYCLAYRVPLPITAEYDIDNYIPLVKDLTFIERINYSEAQP